MIDAHKELARTKIQRGERKKKKMWRPSKLQKHRAEVVALYRAGASLGDLKFWLKLERGIDVARSTVARYLCKLPELANDHSVRNDAGQGE
jgi:hypothetical protein